MSQAKRDYLAAATADIKKAVDWEESQLPIDHRALSLSLALRASIRQASGDLEGAEKDIQTAIDWAEGQPVRDGRTLAIWYSVRASIRLSFALAQG